MSIFVIGFNYKTAPITLREKVYFSIEKLPLYLQDILSTGKVHEAVLLSTCHRSELYCDAEDQSVARDWFLAQGRSVEAGLEEALYVYQGEAAILHIMRVACGLDSMMLGESQIFGQLKEAFSESCASGAVSALFHRLFQQIFNVSKMIRTTTSLGACPVSIASRAVRFARELVPNFSRSHIALVGAGETAALVMRYLADCVTTPLVLLNRSQEKAVCLLAEQPGCVKDLEALPSVLCHVDIVFAATSSPTPVIHESMMQQVMITRCDRPIVLIDVAVPRDIDPAVANHPNVRLYCVDDLKQMMDDTKKGHAHALDKAFELVQQNSQDLFIELQSLDKVAHTIRVYRDQVEALCQVELLKAKEALEQGIDANRVLDDFSYAFINKLMHAPSVKLREAGKAGRFELLRFAKQ
ncbi:MAG: glutamyl-tRNA reductase, partial [Gammaproteobacteria bacterium RIFCSPHIGHO2_12_FULL_42_10]